MYIPQYKSCDTNEGENINVYYTRNYSKYFMADRDKRRSSLARLITIKSPQSKMENLTTLVSVLELAQTLKSLKNHKFMFGFVSEVNRQDVWHIS